MLFALPTNFTTATNASFTMDSAGDMIAWRIRTRSTSNIGRMAVFFSAKTGSPRDIGVVVTADNNGIPNVSGGVPVDVGGGSPTLLTVANASVTNNAVNEFTFTNAYTPSTNTFYWVVIYALATGGTTWDASNRYQIISAYSGFTQTPVAEMSATSTDGSGATWSYAIGLQPFSVLTSAGAYLPMTYAVCPGSTTGQFAPTVSSNPDEYGAIFTVPTNTTVKLHGINYLYFLSSSTTSDHTLFAYTDPLGSPSLLESVAVDVSAFHPATTARSLSYRFDGGPYTLTAGTVCSVSVRATSTGITYHGAAIVRSQAAREACDHFAVIYGATREGGTGAFTAAQDRLFTVVPILEHVGTAGGSGGGPLIGPGRLIR